MANSKISALTGASTPLAGTEVLPIVQSGTTKKVSVSDLTAGRAVSLGVSTITGPDQTTANISTSSNIDAEITSTGSSVDSGGSLVFGAASGAWKFTALKALATNGGGNSQGSLSIGTRRVATDATLTEAIRFHASGGISINSATDPTVGNLALGTGNLVISTSGKGITNSTGAVKLNFSTDRTSLSGAQSVYTGDFYNVGTTQTITISDTHGGYIVITSVQGGVGSSTWTLPFVKRGGSISIGTASKAILTADPIISVATSGGNITVTPLAANTYLTYAIYYTPLAL